MGARGVLPALGASATRRAAGEEPGTGLARQSPAGRPPTSSKKNDGSTEAQKARGETAATPPANRGHAAT